MTVASSLIADLGPGTLISQIERNNVRLRVMGIQVEVGSGGRWRSGWRHAQTGATARLPWQHRARRRGAAAVGRARPRVDTNRRTPFTLYRVPGASEYGRLRPGPPGSHNESESGDGYAGRRGRKNESVSRLRGLAHILVAHRSRATSRSSTPASIKLTQDKSDRWSRAPSGPPEARTNGERCADQQDFQEHVEKPGSESSTRVRPLCGPSGQSTRRRPSVTPTPCSGRSTPRMSRAGRFVGIRDQSRR